MQLSGSPSTVTTAVATPRCCERNGLIYPDGDRRCWTHASAADRQLLDELDEWAIARGIPVREVASLDERLAWPYGPNLYVGMRVDMLAWAETHALRFARSVHRCLDWLAVGRCYTRSCRTWGQGLPGWLDHVTTWISPDQRVLVAQPYRLEPVERDALTDLGSEPWLHVEIAPSGWYGGGTVWIALWAGRSRAVAA